MNKEFHHTYTNLWRQQEDDKYKTYLRNLVNVNRKKYKTNKAFKKMRQEAVKKYQEKQDPLPMLLYNLLYYYYKKDEYLSLKDNRQ